jgi:hypothetical protein
MRKAALAVGAASFLLLGVGIIAVTSKKTAPQSVANGSEASGSSSSGTQYNGNGFETPVQVSKFDYGWVDGNDKAGKQYIELGLTTMQNGKPINVTDLEYVPNKEYRIDVSGSLVDLPSYEPLGGWEFAVTVFDSLHRIIHRGTGKTTSGGIIRYFVDLKPAMAGVYRIRVAAGDAANEGAVVFNLSAKTATLKNTLGE